MDPQLHSGISVIMPTYNNAPLITRAVRSLLLQTFTDWELLIIDDGSTDNTEAVLQKLLPDSRIRYFREIVNKGLGACLNLGIELARNDNIAYLPADDLYFKDHLQLLYYSLMGSRNAILACTGIRFCVDPLTGVDEIATGSATIPGFSMQLVQVLHRKTADRWMERDELTTDDLNRMYWHKLAERGPFCQTQTITCEWVNHPTQLHKLIREDIGGGIFRFKNYFRIEHPIRYQSTVGNYIDEVERYRSFRDKPVEHRKEALKILLVGELSHNPERLVALEEAGHRLYGLWINNPLYYNAVGPLPFGNIETITLENWKKRVEEIQPDIIYAMLNTRAVPLAHQVLLQNPGIPFVWHFKEGPFYTRQEGNWAQLVDLYSMSDGQIYINNEAKDWYSQFIDGPSGLSLILDGDLPLKTHMAKTNSPMFSEKDGEIHTVVPGRAVGLSLQILSQLAKSRIHLHFYGDVHQAFARNWVAEACKIGGRFFHIHPNCIYENWVTEFSRYDAGWLHVFKSKNNSELIKADWNDLNLPSRIATLGVAGVPMLQVDNAGHIVASQSLVKEHNIGYFLKTAQDLVDELHDRNHALRIREKAWEKRELFTFDYHVDRLIEFFRKVIDKKTGKF